MPISLEEEKAERSPVLKRRAIGEEFTGMIVLTPEQRNSHKDGKPTPKRNVDPAKLADPNVPDAVKYRQELVVTLLTVASTMNAGIGDNESVAEPGQVVRLILRGGGFGQWIDAKKAHGRLDVGDIVHLTSTYGQAWDASGGAIGAKLTTQAECEAVPRTQSLGIYGDLTIMAADLANPSIATWVQAAEAKHHELVAASTPRTSLEPAPTPSPAGAAFAAPPAFAGAPAAPHAPGPFDGI